MKTSGGFQQCYNAQAAVEVQSRLIVGERVSQAPNDKEQLEPTVAAISAIGFGQFLLRGAKKVSTEWSLVCLAYNMRRLHTLDLAAKTTAGS